MCGVYLNPILNFLYIDCTTYGHIRPTYCGTIAILSHLDGHLHAFGLPGDESNLSGCLHRIIDLEESDKETIHLLVFLFMQFLSRADQAFPAEEKHMGKVQTIVLSHLYLLLGYSQIDKSFHVSSSRLR